VLHHEFVSGDACLRKLLKRCRFFHVTLRLIQVTEGEQNSPVMISVSVMSNTFDRLAGRSIALNQIADALGISADVLYAGQSADTSDAEAYELLKIWRNIDDPEARRKVMDFALLIAGKCRSISDK
jgi:hypothetical protein